MKFTVYQGSRQLIDGESKGRTMSTQLVQKAHHIEAILRCSRTSSAEIAEWKDEMICAVESEARNAVASIRIVEFLRESTEVRAAVADLQSGDSFRIAVGAAQLLVRSTGVVTADDDDIPF
jgi:hypothetical protein